jgi:hypothetical protein
MRTEYERFCHENKVPLYHQPWWLDAVCGPEAWQALVASADDGRVLGMMPVAIRRRYGLRVIQPPPLTCYGGPRLADVVLENKKPAQQYGIEKQLVTQLIHQLPRVFFTAIQLAPDWTNWLPFYWENFRQTTRYTYFLPPAANMEQATANFKNTVRTDLKKAAKLAFCVRDDDAAATIFELNRLSLRRNGLHPACTQAFFLRLHAALRQRNQVACWLALDTNTRQPVAGLYLILEPHRAGVLLTGLHPAFRHTCATYLLYQAAISFCIERGLVLDLEGSMQRGLEHLFRALGAIQMPYLRVWRRAGLIDSICDSNFNR